MLKAQGLDIDYVVERVAEILNMTVDEIRQPGRYKKLVMARSLICYWTVRELGESMAAIARQFNISTVAVSKAVKRGQKGVSPLILVFISKYKHSNSR